MWEALLAIRHFGCPISDTSADVPEVNVQNLSKAEISGHRAKRLICLRGEKTQIDLFESIFRDHEFVKSFRRISDENSQQAYFTSEIEYNSDNPSILNLLGSHGCYRDSTVSVQRGIEHWGVYIEQKESLYKLIEKIGTLDNDLDLRKCINMGTISDNPSMNSTAILTRLTSRQQEAFETAYSLGYYESNSDITMDDLGEAMDVHPTTAWEHLKKVENLILSESGQRYFGGTEPVKQLIP
ncbi:helix-turn-helix domain-containing protein [Haladaptatus caseinilyticus]|uniref:helix-turn-helix domain-containing protein n=1 Tax=Haladaptatus caseinilyticus TaxID=2993314 RepID=UPI00224A7738|nr:helix-turn-helix domain-containing protein [Haladaptatus caseinilyticus]